MMRPASISISESGRIYRLAVPALQAIVTHLDLRIEREELKVIVDELSRDRMMRLEAVVCQFGANLAKEKPSAELIQFMSGPAAKNEDRETYLQGARDSWEIMSGCDETAHEFAINFDSIRITLIQRIRDLDKSKGDMQSDTIKGTDTSTQEYQDFLESEERASGKKLAIADDELCVPIKHPFTAKN
ncbi:uncharacterized protein GIQ15_04336 [Arthroderma uncinatum]|uniref:uncharacterized protein n=1 Tax=Arthroderma uncinatum TaxID=74035 RepID=UPI00144ABF87|nr:uncharacterized protein GIQ15_04336 [Arthroderma uncinatum]KAF3481577.1 hypothetical protein GIQ15_04336 [Arthroderma uncinatum]